MLAEVSSTRAVAWRTSGRTMVACASASTTSVHQASLIASLLVSCARTCRPWLERHHGQRSATNTAATIGSASSHSGAASSTPAGIDSPLQQRQQ